MEITLPTLILSYLLIYLTGFGAGLLTCCRWKETFMSNQSSSDVLAETTVQGLHEHTACEAAVASAPHITEIKLSQ